MNRIDFTTHATNLDAALVDAHGWASIYFGHRPYTLTSHAQVADLQACGIIGSWEIDFTATEAERADEPGVAKELDRLRDLTGDPETMAFRVKQAAALEVVDVSEGLFNVFLVIAARAQLTRQDLHQLRRHGIQLHINPDGSGL